MHAPAPRPEPPAPADCCGNGCSPCVWDTNADALAEWMLATTALDAAVETGAPPPAPLPSRL